MLLNILPGLRELRAPLAAGYLWLLAGWLAFGDSISLPRRAEDFLDQFSALGQAAALTFGAYIVGSLLSDALTPVWERLRGIRLERAVKRWLQAELSLKDSRDAFIEERRTNPPELEDEGERELERLSDAWYERDSQYKDWLVAGGLAAWRPATEPVSLRGVRIIAGLVTLKPPDFSAEPEDEDEDEFWEGIDPTNDARAVAAELDIARFRLLAEQRDLFNEVDRLRGEAHFRLAVAAPLAALAITLALSDHVAWLGALVAVAVLAWQGMDKLEESGDRVADAIRAGKVHIPALGDSSGETTHPATR